MDLIVIAGFLGAGKTTVLLSLARALVARGRTVAVIENEVGRVGVDPQYLRSHGLELREVFGGCVCCSLAGNLWSTLKQLEEKVAPDIVLLEPSGVASPKMVREILDGYGPGLGSIRMVVLLDIERMEKLRRVIGPLIEAGIESANLVAINKVDLADHATVESARAYISSIRADVPIVACSATRDGAGAMLNYLDPGGSAESSAAGKNDPAESSPATGESGSTESSAAATGETAPPSVRPPSPPPQRDHAHGHEASAQTRSFDVALPSPPSSAGMMNRLGTALDRLAIAIAAEPGAVIGHLKAAVAFAPGDAVVVWTTTSADRPARRLGEVPAAAEWAKVTVNAIAYGIAADRLSELLDSAFTGTAPFC